MDDRLSFMRSDSLESGSSSGCSFQNRVEGAQGEVELQYWPPRRGTAVPPEQLTVFILGNPGLLGYYPPFLNHLHSLLPDSHAIISMSHIGHSPNLPFPDIPLDLPSQLESKIEFIQCLRQYLDAWAEENEGVKPRLALMGHSVGSWLLCEVMKRLNEVDMWDTVQVGYMLFPTLGWIANTWNGWTLWPIFHRPARPLLPLLSPLLRPILPLISLPPTSKILVRSPKLITHVLHLSKSEMEIIREPDVQWYESQKTSNAHEGLLGIWSAGTMDGWVGKDGPLVQECLGGDEGGRVKLLKGVPHAFCLTKEHSELVAEVVANWIVPSIQPPTNESVEQPKEPVGANVVPM